LVLHFGGWLIYNVTSLLAGEWERLKTEYKALKHPIKIGRQGAKPSLIQAVQMAWRGSEVVKLAIHNEK